MWLAGENLKFLLLEEYLSHLIFNDLIVGRCTSNDLKMFINLLRHDLMIDADAKLM